MTDMSDAGAVADADEPKADPQAVKEMLEVAHKRFKRATEFDEDNRKHALECLKFRNLEQWDPQTKNMRENDPEGARPCLVADKTNQYLNQSINDYRQNRPAIKVRPVDDYGDKEVADVFQGIVRHIEDASNADVAYVNAYENVVDGGFGYFRIVTEYCDAMSFDQDIRIVPVKNRFTVRLDPDRSMPNRPPRWGFVFEKMQREDFKKEYPDATPMDWSTDGMMFEGWAFEDYVIIAEYFRIEKKKKTICLWPDGEVTEKGDERYTGQKPVQERTTEVDVVKWSKITGADELEKRDWLGAYVPIIEVVGTELDIEGKSVKSGLLKGAMTPQAVHNYAMSSFVEGVMLAPRASWVAAEGQIEGYEELYRTANRRSISVLPYKPKTEDGHLLPPPARVQPPGLSQGWLQTMQTTEHDIQASMGMYAETMLGIGDAQSGKQELLQQRRGDTATFHYSDNTSRAIRFCGTQLLDLIPKVYDTARVVRILGEDGESEQAEINPDQQAAVRKLRDAQTGAIRKIYNLNVGKYDVTTSTGPSFATKRMESAEFLMQAAQSAKDPVTAQVITYLAMKNNDWPGAEDAARMMKALLPPQIQDDGKDDEGPQIQTSKGPVGAQQAAQIIGSLEQAVQEAHAILADKEQAKQQAEALKAQNEAEKLKIERDREEMERAAKGREFEQRDRDLELKAAEIEIARYEAETGRISATGKVEADIGAANAGQLEAASGLLSAQQIVQEVLAQTMGQAMAPVADALRQAAQMHAMPRVARRPDGSVIATAGFEAMQ